MRLSIIVSLSIAATASLLGCREGSGPSPIDTGPSPTESRFGLYHVDVYQPQPPVYPTETADGPFTTIRTSKSGNRVGTVNARFSYWPAGASAPTYMFPADTIESGFTPTVINDRGEVILVTTTPYQKRPVFIWRDGQLKTLVPASAVLIDFMALNNRGLVILYAGSFGPPRPVREASPFLPDESARPNRFIGETCNYSPETYGASAPILFKSVNDQNEMLTTKFSTFWESGGCRNMPAGNWLFIGEAGLAAGSLGSAIVSDGYERAFLDDLLDPASRALWHIASIISMPADSSIIAWGVRAGGSDTVQVRLTRVENSPAR
jgi:hypothetical protein